MSNIRLELAFLIPDKKKLSVDEVRTTVAASLDAIVPKTLNDMKKSAIKFSSLQDLEDYEAELQQLKVSWNKRFLAKQRANRKAEKGGSENGTNS